MQAQNCDRMFDSDLQCPSLGRVLCRQLEVLNMGWNGFTDEGALAVAQMLTENSTLEEVDLSNNRIRKDGSDAIANAIAGNSTLKVLRLAYNQLGDEGILKWLQTLIENNSLTSLDLNYVPHSTAINTSVHDLIDRSPELDVKVKELMDARSNLDLATLASESLKAAHKVPTIVCLLGNAHLSALVASLRPRYACASYTVCSGFGGARMQYSRVLTCVPLASFVAGIVCRRCTKGARRCNHSRQLERAWRSHGKSALGRVRPKPSTWGGCLHILANN